MMRSAEQSRTSSSQSREHQNTVHGNRLCASCNYNLTGQKIIREEHYSMLIVRCPECGTVAAIQEQPVLGKWANRWGLVLATFWILYVVSFFLSSTAGLSGIALGSGYFAAESFRKTINNESLIYVATLQQGETNAGQYQYGLYGQEFADWWKEQDVNALIQKSGGYFSCIEPKAFLIWIPLALASILFGVFFATVLANWSRQRLAIMTAVTGATLLAWSWLYTLPMKNPTSSWGAAEEIIVPTFLYISIAFAIAAIIPSLMLGRPIARLLIRAFLSPRMQASLSGLWISDGKEPPSFPQKK